ncbi:MAG: hypothetical protein RLZZ127_2553, partial [Planctomycetota bacterium]
TGEAAARRIDATVDFSWSGTPSGTTLPTDGFAVRWTGLVVPEHSQVYTFFTSTDDGTRLWLGNDLVIDRWVNQGTTEYSATRACTAGVPVPVRMEFFDNSGGAVARLSWSSASVAKAIIPTERLRSEAAINAAPVIGVLTGTPAGLGVTLAATVIDDGRPTAAAPTLAWTRMSGPGSVAITDPAAMNTTATVGVPGTHRFRLTASDGAATVFREVEVVVDAGGNLPPAISTPAAADPDALSLP